jgi:surface carbohydrate biosynthesis protein (TIGR04326 family)
MEFEWQRKSTEVENWSWLRRLNQSLPNSLQALIWLIRYLLLNWSLRGVGLAEWKKTKGELTFVSYLVNLDPDAANDGRFESRYWAHLPDELHRGGLKTNWLHLYVKDELLPTGAKAAEAIRRFNDSGLGAQTHVTLDAFLDLRVVFRTLCDWLRMAWVGRLVQLSNPSALGVELNFWPLIKEDWRRSISGQIAISNALFLNLFESALMSLPKQRCGVYLQENQAWEFAFIHAWKTAGHGFLIGSPHSTIRYWDLRYFFDPRCFSRDGKNNLPLPDRVALNGSASMDAYRDWGYPVKSMVEIEALRYLHLDKVIKQSDSVAQTSSVCLRVLVLGDYLVSNTRLQMRLLERAATCLPPGTVILVKPHPACPIQVKDFPNLSFEITTVPIWELLSKCDVTYTSSVTSAAVDAYCTGVPVVSMLDPSTLNLSPLRGRDGFLFASTPEELTHALISAASRPKSTKVLQDFFTVDSNLVRWRKLLLEPFG